MVGNNSKGPDARTSLAQGRHHMRSFMRRQEKVGLSVRAPLGESECRTLNLNLISMEKLKISQNYFSRFARVSTNPSKLCHPHCMGNASLDFF